MISTLTAQLADYGRLMRFDKPIGTYLLLWPTLWSLWIAAEGFPDERIFLIFVLGVIMMRAAGCIINDFADRNIDTQVERTRNRPLATGDISTLEAICLFVILVGLSFSLVLLTNTLTIGLSVIAVLLASMYPFMKRFTYLPQVILGAAFSMSIPMAFAAQTGDVPHYVWLIYFANLIWTVAYDTIYAMVDRDDDLKVGVKSTAILFGDADKLIIFALQMIMLLIFIVLSARLNLTHWFYFSLCIVLLLFSYQQYLIKDRTRNECFQAFLHNHWVGLVIFIGLLLNYGFGR
jgi:4-hydroxybenzoate polyprenyltransferase